MADVKWIKIVTDIFDNRKIKLIRKMPEGAEIVVTWFQLLCLAGETNDNGLIYITKAVPYTEESLAIAFDTPLSTIRLALDTFSRLDMIKTYDSFFCVANWEKYQNTDGLTKIREQTRARVAKHRQKQLDATQCNVTVTLPVTLCNATEREQDIDKDNIKGDKPPNVKRFCPPTVEEVEAYCKSRGNSVSPTAFIDFYSAKGWMIGKNKMTDWKASVRTWERKEGKKSKWLD